MQPEAAARHAVAALNGGAAPAEELRWSESRTEAATLAALIVTAAGFWGLLVRGRRHPTTTTVADERSSL